MQLPEGPRSLMLFEHLDGDTPGDVLSDVEATGRGLALLHQAGEDYAGPPSLYVLELPHLLHASLRQLAGAPTMNDELRAAFALIAARLEALEPLQAGAGELPGGPLLGGGVAAGEM